MEHMIGIRLKERRKKLGITIAQIHDETGISTGILSAWERGEKLPSAPSLIKLANILSCSVDWILFGETQESLKSELPSSLSQNDILLLSSFHELDIDDQDEILAMIELKIKRKNRGRKSSLSEQNESIETA